MNLYEEVMPKYLAMSRADLIAEILEKGQPMRDFLEKQADPDFAEVEPEGFEEMMGMTANLAQPPKEVERAANEMAFANDVLKNRFGLTIEFHYGANF